MRAVNRSVIAAAAAANVIAATASLDKPSGTVTIPISEKIRRKKRKRYYDPGTQPRPSVGGADRRTERAERALAKRETRVPASELDVARVSKAEAKRARKAALRAAEVTRG